MNHAEWRFENRVGEHPVREPIEVNVVSLLWIHGRHEFPHLLLQRSF